MAQWHFWGEKKFSEVYENIYIRSLVEDWFKIIDKIVEEINIQKSSFKLMLDIGCGEGHTTKQILDRVQGKYICDLLEPNIHALATAEAFLAPENYVGEISPNSFAVYNSAKKFDIIFTSHTNYYWAINQKDYDYQLSKLTDLLNNEGKLLILTLPKESCHYKIMLRQIYPEFNYAEYIIEYYRKLGFKVEVKKLKMRIFIGDMFTTNNRFDLKVFYRFIHNTDSFPNEKETEKFLKKINEYQKDGYIDFQDYLIIVEKIKFQ